MKIRTVLGVTLACLLGGIVTGFYINHRMNMPESVESSHIIEYVVDNSAAIKRLKIENSLVESLEREQKLIVLEADLSEDVVIDDSYSSWDALKKMQRITVKSTAKFTTDLGAISDGDIIFDEANGRVTLMIKRPEIDSITINEEQTVFHSIEKGLFRFGDIKLTPAELNEIYRQAKQSMNNMLILEISGEAEECAKDSVTSLVNEFLSVLEVEDCEVVVAWK